MPTTLKGTSAHAEGTFRSAAMVSVIALTVSLAGTAAFAQDQGTDGQSAKSDTQTASDSQPAVNEIFITGSRVRRSGFDSPNPLTVLDSDYMEKLGIVNVSDVVASMPQNESYVSPTNVGLGNFNVGASLANLRGLNPYYGTRTLTLVDGRRFVPSTNGGAVDLNLIPSLLVQRTETVTGGASAAYGTDAVAGVVNVILDKNLNGIKAQVDYGQTFRGDGKDKHIALAGGWDVGSRFHIVAGGEYQDSGEIGDCASSRSWCAQSWDDISNPGYASGNGYPAYMILPNSKSANTTHTGVFPAIINAPSIGGKRFNDAGTALLDFDPGTFVSPTASFVFQGRQGGDGESVYEGLKIRVPVKRFALFGHVDYDLNDTTKLFFEAGYGKRKSTNVGWAFGATFPGSKIYPDNAYLTPAIAALIPATGAYFNRNMLDLARQTNDTANETYRFVFGGNGKFNDNWGWDFYYQYGKNSQHQRLNNLKVNQFFSWAADAVFPYNTPGDASSGLNTAASPVCRVVRDGVNPTNPLASYAADCVPMNLFGLNNASPESLAYAHRTLIEDFTYQQHVVSANINGDLFDGFGAGPVGVAVGAEYRVDTGEVTHGGPPPYYSSFALSYQNDFAGKQEVLEGYGELNIPLLKDLAFARNLELNAAIRQTHNKSINRSVGSAGSRSTNITTWKISGIYDPTDWLRFRATRSRDIRVAGFRELYISQNPSTPGGYGGTVVNPWTGNTDNLSVLGGGNVNLTPEKANTWTIGTVLQPGGALDGLRFSADWYEIQLNNAINSNIGAQNITNLCYTVGQYCDRITATSGYALLTFIDNTAVNYARITSRGFDFEVDYQLPLNRIKATMPGSINVRSMASYQYDFIINTGASSLDYAGASGPLDAFTDWNPAPYWIVNSWITYSNDPFSLTVQGRFIGAGAYRRDRVGPNDPGYDPTLPNSININHVPSRLYVNLAFTYDLDVGDTHGVQLFGSINNLFDKKPPIAPGGNGSMTNPVYFDVVGAAFRMGVRMQY